MLSIEKSSIAMDHTSYFSEKIRNRFGISASDFSGKSLNPGEVISLNFGLPDPSLFPLEQMEEAAKMAIRGRNVLQYGGGDGTKRLINWIIENRRNNYNLSCESNELIITSGSSQGIDLVGKLFIDPGDEVWFESPSYFGAISIYSQYGAKMKGFPMDDNGLVVDEVAEELRYRRINNLSLPKLFYIIPNFQNPTGHLMSLDRRKRIAQLAKEYGFYVIEDDAYGDLGFENQSIAPIKVFAPDHTIYLSTFSKTVAPGLRLAWMMAPADIISNIQYVKAEGGTSGYTQEVLANFFETTNFSLHLETIRSHYKQRRDAMLNALQSYFPTDATWITPLGGFFVWVTLSESIHVIDLFSRAVENGVNFVGGTPFYMNGKGQNQMRLSFSLYAPETIEEGIFRLSQAVYR